MYNFLVKNGTAVAMGVGSLVTLIFIGTVWAGLSSSGYDTSTDLMAVDYKNFNGFNVGIYLTIVLSVIAILLMLGGVILDLIQNRKTSMKMVIGIIALIVVFIVLYSTATFDTGGKWDALNAEFKVGEKASKFISAGIWTCGILLVISVLSIVVSEVKNFFK
ncbi:MAG TPA: hypothetical protein PKD51_10855 [Saprospiraceae bacterium]|nr:hypothetical protein [Saprospiraceae bacterium]HMU05816.1 hypothetical protein [Saprospiraceae bacterium]